MKNTQLLKHAIGLLESINPEDLESVQINGSEYNDGTYAITIDLLYPEKSFSYVEPDNTRAIIGGVEYELFDRIACLGDQVVYYYKGNIGDVISDVIDVKSDSVDIEPYLDTDESEITGYSHDAYLVAERKGTAI